MPLVFPVQCRVISSVGRSANDQMLKYGSCVTSGTAGGRNDAVCAETRYVITEHIVRKIARCRFMANREIVWREKSVG
jgi:hypothetical protein